MPFQLPVAQNAELRKRSWSKRFHTSLEAGIRTVDVAFMSSISSGLTDGCTYVPLESYDWALFDILTGPRGRCHGVSLAFNPAVWCLTAALHTATVWMSLGLNVQIFGTFKRRNTLYFWSILITAWAILLVTILFDMRYYTRAGNGNAIQWASSICWVFESMGFSFVLISRLYLIEDSRYLNFLPMLVIVLDLTVHIIVLVGKAGHLSPHGWRTIIYFTPIFFTVQETLLSSLYVYLFIKFMKHNCYGSRTRSMFNFLLFAEAVVICFDIAMVTLNSLKYEIAKTILTPFFYACKLKIEFLVLNRLMDFKQKDGELEYPRRDAIGPNDLPESGSTGSDSTDRSSTLQHVPGVVLDHVKADVWTNAAQLHQANRGRSEDEDEISQLERQYLGRGQSYKNPREVRQEARDLPLTIRNLKSLDKYRVGRDSPKAG